METSSYKIISQLNDNYSNKSNKGGVIAYLIIVLLISLSALTLSIIIWLNPGFFDNNVIIIKIAKNINETISASRVTVLNIDSDSTVIAPKIVFKHPTTKNTTFTSKIYDLTINTINDSSNSTSIFGYTGNNSTFSGDINLSKLYITNDGTQNFKYQNGALNINKGEVSKLISKNVYTKSFLYKDNAIYDTYVDLTAIKNVVVLITFKYNATFKTVFYDLLIFSLNGLIVEIITDIKDQPIQPSGILINNNNVFNNLQFRVDVQILFDKSLSIGLSDINGLVSNIAFYSDNDFCDPTLYSNRYNSLTVYTNKAVGDRSWTMTLRYFRGQSIKKYNMEGENNLITIYKMSDSLSDNGCDFSNTFCQYKSNFIYFFSNQNTYVLLSFLMVNN